MNARLNHYYDQPGPLLSKGYMALAFLLRYAATVGNRAAADA